ncbi:Conserved non-functional serine recombinase [Eptesipox virus]|uniref:Protein OPG061 n=1 Tax=Eptesipox virus TaxID=1329402 RepID=A0A220T696_9POXV|nr:Conserved non-functional serine recombinase [Eptesipox virus]ASK51234.1 Conserved non-functional serine recombinase [Eptesipox virus]
MDTCAIITSIISLFDTSIEYQLQICRSVASKLSIEIYTEINEHGFITESDLNTNIWKRIIYSSVNTLIFYKTKQISSSVEQFYHAYTQLKEHFINIIFAKDNLLFSGEPPQFSIINFTLQSVDKVKIKDLLTLLDIETCNYKIVIEYINSNFGSIDALLKLFKNNKSIIMSILAKSKLNIKTPKKAMIKYKKIIYKIKSLQSNYIQPIEDICLKFNNISLESNYTQ